MQVLPGSLSNNSCPGGLDDGLCWLDRLAGEQFEEGGLMEEFAQYGALA